MKGGPFKPKSIAVECVMKVLMLLTELSVAGFPPLFSLAFLILLKSLIIAHGLEKVLTMDSFNSQNCFLLALEGDP